MKIIMNASFDLRLEPLADRYRAGDITPRRLVAQLREKALRLNDEYHVFIHLLSLEEMEPYLAALEERRPDDLPLYGVPFAVKDSVDLAGVPTTAACPAFAYTPGASATVVRQLIDLGAIPLGKTNLDQFGTGVNGTRSPYGECRNSVHPDYPAGGSSSGSALAVALGLSSFALGTDVGGSGRIPAALNNLVGLKTSKGILSDAGHVPICRSLQCITYFTSTAAEASRLLALTALDKPDPADAYSRANPAWNDGKAFGVIPRTFRFGLPQYPEFMGCAESAAIFARVAARLRALGGEAVEIDFTPFAEASRLLFGGPWLAERYGGSLGAFMEDNPQALLPVIREVLAPAREITGVAVFRALHRLQELKAQCDRLIKDLDCILTPAYPRPATLAELHAEPIRRNLELGFYSSFMNLLDYAAVAVPAGFLQNGLPSGVTLFGQAFSDQRLLSFAHALQGEIRSPRRY
ncbi:MAG: allophanate hydrolase [Zoogloeaceae bacterium]|jgi:allophanate hydrolase|nr:allophanate hydrolase [Zoogloeaceae bacterium]